MAKVLIVDDSPTQAAMLAQMLLQHQHVVEIEGTGKRGLNRALQSTFDLLILDLNLPDMTGLEICQQYKATGRTTPVMLVTSEDQLYTLSEEQQAIADYYCTKDQRFLEPRVEIILLRQRRRHIVISVEKNHATLNSF
ncbi:MAG: response regulator [Chloroflexota bacterium]|nr:response regulator [Chloroflexota bacterium]